LSVSWPWRYEACFGLDHENAGWTLLHKAMAYDCRRCALLLLNNIHGLGTSVRLLDRQGRSPEEVATWFQSTRAGELLLAEQRRVEDEKRRALAKSASVNALMVGGARHKAKRKAEASKKRIERKAAELGLKSLPGEPPQGNLGNLRARARAFMNAPPSSDHWRSPPASRETEARSGHHGREGRDRSVRDSFTIGGSEHGGTESSFGGGPSGSMAAQQLADRLDELDIQASLAREAAAAAKQAAKHAALEAKMEALDPNYLANHHTNHHTSHHANHHGHASPGHGGPGHGLGHGRRQSVGTGHRAAGHHGAGRNGSARASGDLPVTHTAGGHGAAHGRASAVAHHGQHPLPPAQHPAHPPARAPIHPFEAPSSAPSVAPLAAPSVAPSAAPSSPSSVGTLGAASRALSTGKPRPPLGSPLGSLSSDEDLEGSLRSFASSSFSHHSNQSLLTNWYSALPREERAVGRAKCRTNKADAYFGVADRSKHETRSVGHGESKRDVWVKRKPKPKPRGFILLKRKLMGTDGVSLLRRAMGGAGEAAREAAELLVAHRSPQTHAGATAGGTGAEHAVGEAGARANAAQAKSDEKSTEASAGEASSFLRPSDHPPWD